MFSISLVVRVIVDNAGVDHRYKTAWLNIGTNFLVLFAEGPADL